MKAILIKNSYLFIILLLAFQSCKKDYYQDTGVHKSQFDGTVWDYLNSRPDLFKELTNVIRYAGLEEDFKTKQVTFFSPPDRAIKKSIVELNAFLFAVGQDSIKSYEQVKPAVWREFLGEYIFKERFFLKDYPQIDTLDLQGRPGQGYLSYFGRPMNIGVLYNDVVVGNTTAGVQVIKYAGYRQLYLNKIQNSSDNSSLFSLITAPVATSDIQCVNGNLHVVNYLGHFFGFNKVEFRNKAIEYGIDYN